MTYFSAHHRTQGPRSCFPSRSLVLLLLARAGVEQNPGPGEEEDDYELNDIYGFDSDGEPITDELIAMYDGGFCPPEPEYVDLEDLPDIFETDALLGLQEFCTSILRLLSPKPLPDTYVGRLRAVLDSTTEKLHKRTSAQAVRFRESFPVLDLAIWVANQFHMSRKLCEVHEDVLCDFEDFLCALPDLPHMPETAHLYVENCAGAIDKAAPWASWKNFFPEDAPSATPFAERYASDADFSACASVASARPVAVSTLCSGRTGQAEQRPHSPLHSGPASGSDGFQTPNPQDEHSGSEAVRGLAALRLDALPAEAPPKKRRGGRRGKKTM